MTRQDASRKAALEHRVTSTPASKAPSVPLSLFIIGVSRSGKTTLERLVSTLKGVKCGYESHLVERAVKRASQGSGLPTLASLHQLPIPLDDDFRKFYFAELRSVASNAKIFTNTHPAMIHSVGRMATALPNSRFVFVRRDIDDVALRILGKKYKSGNHYAYDLRTILDHVDWYYEMVEIWCKKLPLVTCVVHYEDIIANPRAALETVAGLCGVSVPEGPPPKLGDDRGCAAPYRDMMAVALDRIGSNRPS